MAGKTWHYTINNETLGPVSSRELRQLAESGTLSPDDLVWREGTTDWVPASSVKGLQFGPTPPPVSVSPPPAAVPSPLPASPPATPHIPAPASTAVSPAPFNPNQPLSTPPPAGPTPSGKGSNTNLIVAVAIAVVLCAATGVGAFLIGQSSSAPEEQTADSRENDTEKSSKSPDENDVDDRADALHKELEGERSDIRDEIKDLKKERDSLEQKNRTLDQENKQLEKQISNLVSRLDTIKLWESADFVMVNPTEYSLAFRDTPAGLVLENKATGEVAHDTIAASRGWNIPRIQDDRAL
ncbi:MAG: GYF domain-containing protein, partial [Planctomycetota bacterium]|nr:GYF domain-containing protein [Planctomycetota bacterium]